MNTHRDAINEAHSLVRMESTVMLRSEARFLASLVASQPDHTATPIARAMLDMVMIELEKREATQGSARP